MKRTRLTSLLLATLLTVTSLPITVPLTVSASSAPVQTNNLLDGITPTTISGVAVRDRDTADDRGGYLHFGSQTSATVGLCYNFNTDFVAGNTYYISFDARAAVASSNYASSSWLGGREALRICGNVKQATARNGNYGFWEISRVPSEYLSFTTSGKQVLVAKNYTVAGTAKTTIEASSNFVGVGIQELDKWDGGPWRSYELKIKATENQNDAFICFYTGTGESGKIPFDIDNIKLYTREGDSDQGAVTLIEADCIDFNGNNVKIATADSNVGAAGYFCVADVTNIGATDALNGFVRKASDNGASITRVASTEKFTEAAVTSYLYTQRTGSYSSAGYPRLCGLLTSNTYLTYNTASVGTLEPGVYRLSGEFRDGFEYASYSPVTLTAKVDSEAVGSTSLTTEWTDVSFDFVVDSAKSISSITFSTNQKKTLQFRNVTLEYVRPATVKPTQPEYTTDSATSVAASGLLNGATVSGDGLKVTKPTDKVNGFLTIEARSGSDNGPAIASIKLNETFVVDRTYYVGFNIRNSVPTVSGVSMYARVMLNNKGGVKEHYYDLENGKTSLYTVNDYMTSPTPYSEIEFESGDANQVLPLIPLGNGTVWRYVESQFTPVKDADTNIVLQIARGTGAAERHPIDIDNFAVWYYDDNNAIQYVYETNDFDTAGADIIGKNRDTEKFYSGNATLTHGFDETYYTVTSATPNPSVTFECADDSVSGGIYTFSADVRVPEYIAHSSNYATANKRKAVVTFNVNGENSKAVSVTSNATMKWGKIEASVVVGENDYIESIVVTGGTASDAVKTLDFKNVNLVRTTELEFDEIITAPDNLLDNASVKYTNGGIVAKTAADNNGYLSVGPLGANGSSVTTNFLNIHIPGETEAGAKYYISFDYRSNAEVSNQSLIGSRALLVQVNGGAYAVPTDDTYALMPKTSDGVAPADNLSWTKYTASFDTPAALKFLLRRGYSGEIAGFDIDNFKIWYVKDGKTVDVYENNFDDRNKSLGSAFVKNEAKIIHAFEEDYSEMHTSFGSAPYIEYDVTALDLDEGVYTFSIDMRLPDFVFKGGSNTKVKEAEQYNIRKATVTFYYSDGTTETPTTAVTKDVIAVWDRISMSAAIPRGCTLKSIKLVTNVEDNRFVMIKNPSLVKDYEYAQTFSDTDGLANLLTNSKVSASEGTGIATVDQDQTNGFLTIPTRTYGASNFATLTLEDEIEIGTTYYISYDARLHVNAHNISVIPYVIRQKFGSSVAVEESDGTFFATTVNTEYTTADNASGTSYTFPSINTNWSHVELKATPTDKEGTPISIVFDRGTLNQNHAFDIDNIKVVAVDSTGNKTTIYENNFDDAAVSPTTGKEKFSSSLVQLIHNFERDYSTIKPLGSELASVNYDLRNLEVDGYGEVTLGEGVYTLEFDARVPLFVFTKDADNNRTFTATFTFDNGDTSVVTATATPVWYSKTLHCIVPKDRSLVSIDLEMTEKNGTSLLALDYANIRLTSEAFPVVKADEDEEEVNYLDGVTMYVDNTAPVEVNIDPNPYLNVGKRKTTDNNFLVINPKIAFNADTVYYFSMRVRGTDGATTQIRPKFDTDNKDETLITKEATTVEIPGYTDYVGMNADYIIPVESLFDDGVCSWSPVLGETRGFPYTRVGAEWTTFEGSFTPVETLASGKGKIYIGRGPNSAYVQPIDIDDIKIWTAGGKIVYENTFDSDDDKTGISSPNASIARISPVPNFLELAPIDKNKEMVITYNLDLTDEEAVEGKYSFRVSAKAAKETASASVARVVFIYEDGTEDVQYMNIGSEWSYIGKSDRLGRYPNLETIKIIINSEVAIQLTNPVLNIEYRWKYGKPNRGIVMVLLKKLQGKMIAPRLYEFLSDGSFDTVTPTIHNEVVVMKQDETHEGFWAKQWASSATTMSIVTENGNTFVRVSNLNSDQRGIYYNTGVTLQPGKYTFSVDLRVSETAEDKNYTAYKWHSADKSWMYMRTILQNPDSMTSGNYFNFDPVDKTTAMNATGMVIGYQSKITRQWTTYTDELLITKPTTVIFKIGGGTSGASDSHGFDIDNVSLTGYLYADGSTGYEVEEPVNLIENGDFAKAPTVIEGDKYDSGKKNAWFQNNGMDYKYDINGYPIKDQPKINHDQKITWNEEGYITVSGREYNNRSVWYNTGLTLKAGTYKLSVDFKTAKAGETSSVRVSADGLFTAAAADALSIKSDAWTTKTVTFKVTQNTALRLSFYGGPGAGYKHDYCIDNIVLEKLS